MDPRLLTLYEQELRYFRESSGEFARAFPKIAHRLGIEGQDVADPYVERLIEATAFLAARVGLKLDAEYPRFTGHLLDIVYPQFMAPTPSMIVVSLAIDPDDANLAGGPTLPRGSGLRARHAVGQNTHCEFRTSRALRVWPVEVQRAQYFTYAPDLPLAQHPQSREIRGGLRIALRATAGLKFDQIALDELLIHFGGAEDVAWQLHECMLGKPLGVLVQPLSAGGVAAGAAAGAVRQLPGERGPARRLRGRRGAAARHRHRLLGPPAGAGVLRLPAALPVRAHRGPAARAVGDGGERGRAGGAVLARRCGAREARQRRQRAAALRAGDQSLFSKRLDRVTVNEGVSQFHLVPDRTRPQDFEVHTVTEVIGHGNPAGADATPEQPFLPFYAAFHGSRHSHPAYFTTTREPRMPSARQRTEGHRSSHIGSEVYMQIVDPQQAPYAGSLRQLAVSALVTNRDLPLLMPLGRENDFDCIDAFPAQRVRMVRGPSRPVSPVVNHGLGWRVIDHLALNYLSLADSSRAAGRGRAARDAHALRGAWRRGAAGPGARAALGARRSRWRGACRWPGRSPSAAGWRSRSRSTAMPSMATAPFSSAPSWRATWRGMWRSTTSSRPCSPWPGRGEIMRWRPLCGARPIL